MTRSADRNHFGDVGSDEVIWSGRRILTDDPVLVSLFIELFDVTGELRVALPLGWIERSAVEREAGIAPEVECLLRLPASRPCGQ